MIREIPPVSPSLAQSLRDSSENRRMLANMAATTSTDSAGMPMIHNKTLSLLTPVPADITIAQAATILPIAEVAKALKLQDDELDLYGKYKAKVSISVRDRLAHNPNGKYVCVAGITPTPLGEGKSTTAVTLHPHFLCLLCQCRPQKNACAYHISTYYGFSVDCSF
jgi:hypothetical protein